MPDFISYPVNSSFEAALRTLVVLCHFSPNEFDLDTLTSLEYLLVHSADLGGPPSIHPATPYRSGEILVRKEVVEKGIHLLVSRGLAGVNFSEVGISFYVEDFGVVFLDSLESSYVSELRQRAIWLFELSAETSLRNVIKFIEEKMSIWGAGLEEETLLNASLK